MQIDYLLFEKVILINVLTELMINKTYVFSSFILGVHEQVKRNSYVY